MPALSAPWLISLMALAAAGIAGAWAALERYWRKEQEAYMDRVAEQVRDGLLVTDVGGRIRRFNGAFTNMFDMTIRSDLEGHSLKKVVARQKFEGTLVPLLASRQPGTAELSGRRRDGQRSLLVVTASELRKGERFFVFRDVASERAMERELDINASIIRTLTELAPVTIRQCNGNGELVFLNRHWETFTGVPIETAQAKGWARFVHPDDWERVKKATRAAMDKRQPYDIEYRLFTRTGWRWILDTSVPHVEGDGTFVGYLGVIMDIDDRRRSVARLQESEARFRDVAMTASDMLWETDAEGRFLYLSDRAEAIIGVSAEQALGRTPWSLGIENANAALDATASSWRLNRPAAFRNVTFLWTDAKAGTRRWVMIGGKPVFDRDGRFAGYRGSASDVTAEVEAEAKLRYQATHDGLTGLPNRSAMLEMLSEMLSLTKEPRIGVVCLDLDRFKDVNDTFGHSVGDNLLKNVATRLTSIVSQPEAVARVGGDEFTILLTNVADESALADFCQQLIELSAEPYELDGLRVHVGISAGAAMAELDQSAEDVLKHADFALYEAKRQGRETWRLYTSALEGDRRQRKKLEIDLRKAIEDDHLLVHYQPQVDLTTHQMIAVEALTRWHRLEGGDAVSPLAFIPLAEESRLIVQLGEFVLRRAAADITPFDELCLAVNLSPVQLLRTDLVAMIESILDGSGLAPERLELEITETALLKDDHAVKQTMLDLKRLGVKLALDDFGTGFSSLSYLQRLPFDTIKLDRSFIKSLDHDPSAVSIVHAVIGLGTSLDMKIVAEGVETSAQARFLLDEGCRIAQGFLFAPALPPEEIARLRGMDLSRRRGAAA